ncbi:FAD-binding molybdopterin dehydrogenase [bacterium]|nr:MAG: FAD-binding molybdopterin dehydrogenase [bacterium]
MDLVTIEKFEALGPEGPGAVQWQEGDAWLAGGTWLFSEPQDHLRRLIDLGGLGWRPLTVSDAGLEIAATCPILQLECFVAPAEWPAAALFPQCAHSLLASFKIQKMATVGGNVCMSLPAGAMVSLTASLEGICTILLREGGERQVPVIEFVTGNHQNLLRPGDLLRSILLPESALRKRSAFRRLSLTHQGRSTVLMIATQSPETGEIVLTVTASTARPVQMRFDLIPEANALQERLREAIPDSLYFDDVHGAPEYRKHLTLYFAEELRRELLTETHR